MVLILIFVSLEVGPLIFILYSLYKELGIVKLIQDYFSDGTNSSDTGATKQNNTEPDEASSSPMFTRDALLSFKTPQSQRSQQTEKGRFIRESNLLPDPEPNRLKLDLDLPPFEEAESMFEQSIWDDGAKSSRHTMAVMYKPKKPKPKKKRMDDDEEFDKAIVVDVEVVNALEHERSNEKIRL